MSAMKFGKTGPLSLHYGGQSLTLILTLILTLALMLILMLILTLTLTLTLSLTLNINQIPTFILTVTLTRDH